MILNKEEVLDIRKSDIRKIQKSGRGLSYCQQDLYKELDKCGMDYGTHWIRNGKVISSCRQCDLGVRRDLFEKDSFFYFKNKIGNIIYLPSDLELWDQVALEIKSENRNKIISEILD